MRMLIPVVFALAVAGMPASAAAQPCTFSVDYATLRLGPAAGNGGLRVVNSAACGSVDRTVSSTEPWLTASAFKPTSFLSFTYTANTTGAIRTAVILIDGIPSVTVAQDVSACVVSVTPSSVAVPVTGGTTTFAVQTTTADCLYSVAGFPFPPFPLNPNGPGWLTPGTNSQGVTGTQSFAFEIGSRPFDVRASSNAFSSSARSVILTFGGAATGEVSQPVATCQFTFTPNTIAVPANGGTSSASLTGVGSDCSYSTVTIRDVTVTGGASGTAPATVTVSVPPNPGPGARTAQVIAVNAILNINQAGSPVGIDVGFSSSPLIGFGAIRNADGTIRVTAPEPVRITNEEDPSATWTATASEPWIVLTPASGTSPGTMRVSVDPAAVAALQPGIFTGTVNIFSSVAPQTPRPLSVQLRYYSGQPATAPPFIFGAVPIGFVDSPADGATGLAGAIGITGWAVDAVMLTGVRIYRNAVAGEPAGEVFIGDAQRVFGARPDLNPFYSFAPEWRYGGWGYMLLSNVLPNGGNGTFTFSVYADDIEGNHTLLGRRTVTFDNAHAIAPFGTIDVPAQGETVSGTIVNSGWILTPAGKSIPTDGSTINVFIDGTLVSPVSAYNLPRPDVRAFFPDLANSGGPGARLSIDTTQFADGVHTIAWGVVDSNGEAAGIGSRYFTIRNGASSQVLRPRGTRAASTVQRLSGLRTDVWAQIGIDDSRPAFRLDPDAQGLRAIELIPGERVELTLDRGNHAWCGTYEAHQIAGAVAGTLPAGASLDSARGIFRWQPTAEFTGRFDFVFVQRGCDGVERRVSLAVTLAPRVR